MGSRVLKWPVPIDDDEHRIGPGPVALVAVQNERVGTARQVPADTVMVWTLEGPVVTNHRRARVFGTGHLVPDGWVHIGSTLSVGGALVWHVFAEEITDG